MNHRGQTHDREPMHPRERIRRPSRRGHGTRREPGHRRLTGPRSTPRASRPSRPYLLILVTLLFALPACDSGILRPLPDSETPHSIDFIVEDTLFEPGDFIEIGFANRSPQGIRYNFCHRAQLQRRTGRRWVEVKTWPEDVVCLAILRNLAPGESTTVELPIWDFVEAGVYRIRAPVDWPREEDDLLLFSNAFRIVDD